jgi:exonuclease VII small subunit
MANSHDKLQIRDVVPTPSQAPRIAYLVPKAAASVSTTTAAPTFLAKLKWRSNLTVPKAAAPKVPEPTVDEPEPKTMPYKPRPTSAPMSSTKRGPPQMSPEDVHETSSVERKSVYAFLSRAEEKLEKAHKNLDDAKIAFEDAQLEFKCAKASVESAQARLRELDKEQGIARPQPVQPMPSTAAAAVSEEEAQEECKSKAASKKPMKSPKFGTVRQRVKTSKAPSIETVITDQCGDTCFGCSLIRREGEDWCCQACYLHTTDPDKRPDGATPKLQLRHGERCTGGRCRYSEWAKKLEWGTAYEREPPIF